MTRANGLAGLAAAAVLLAAGMALCPSAGRADDVIVKTITPDKPPEGKAPDQPKASEPGGQDPKAGAKPDPAKPADPANAEPREKPLFDWPPPAVVIRTAMERFGLTDEQKAKAKPILDGADKEAAALLKQMKDKEPQERRAAMYKLCDATVAKLVPLLNESQGRRLKGALKSAIAAPQGVRIGIGRDGTLTVEQPAAPAIIDLWLSQYAPGVDLAEPQATGLREKLRPLAEQFARLQSEMASKYVAAGDKDDPEEVRKRGEERRRQEKELAKQYKPRRELLKAVREAISQALSPEQRDAARQDRQGELEAGVKPMLNYYRGWLNRPGLDLTAEQKQKMQGLIDAATEAVSKIAGGDEDQFAADWPQLNRQLSRDLLSVMTAEQKEKLNAPPPARTPAKTEPPKTEVPKAEPPKQGNPPASGGPTELPPI
jgi:Spy/CpxP family protein refolding chaperone